MAVWMDLLLVSAALLPWVMQSTEKRATDAGPGPLAAKTAAEPVNQPHQAPEF